MEVVKAVKLHILFMQPRPATGVTGLQPTLATREAGLYRRCLDGSRIDIGVGSAAL